VSTDSAQAPANHLQRSLGYSEFFRNLNFRYRSTGEHPVCTALAPFSTEE
jgi:hypothetical protein